MNWYYEGARKRSFIVIVVAFAMARLFGHVWDVDFGLVEENAKMVMENAERAEHRRQEQEARDREYQKMQEEERYYWMMSDKYEKEKKEQGFNYYCKKD